MSYTLKRPPLVSWLFLDKEKNEMAEKHDEKPFLAPEGTKLPPISGSQPTVHNTGVELQDGEFNLVWRVDNPASKDWVGLYESKAKADTQYLAFQWASRDRESGNTHRYKTGRTANPGRVARYFHNGSRVQESKPVPHSWWVDKPR